MNEAGLRSFPCTLSTDVKVITALVLVINAYLFAYFCWHGSLQGLCLMLAVSAIIVAVGFVNWPRSIEVRPGEITIRTPVRSIRVAMDRDFQAERTPELFKLGTIRLFGCGGFLGFTGLYRHVKKGRFTAYVSNRKNAVLLVSGSRQIAVSPDDPDNFITAINAMRGAGLGPE